MTVEKKETAEFDQSEALQCVGETEMVEYSGYTLPLQAIWTLAKMLQD
jgi:hypothetical protein